MVVLDIIILTQCVNLSMSNALRCTSLIGNPVKIGSGPAAVTPPCTKQSQAL